MGNNSLPKDTALYWLKKHAMDTPDKIAIIEAGSGKSITYKDFWDKSINGVTFLKNLGVVSEARVCIAAFSSIEFLVSYFAVHMCGAIAIPIERQYREKQIHDVSNYFETSFFLSENSGMMNVPKGDFNEDEIEISDEAIGTIIFTTGTTSKSKGVMLTLKSTFCSADNYIDAVGLCADDTISVSVPLSHNGGLRHSVASVIAGSTLLLMEGIVFIKDVISYFNKYNVTVIRLVPTQLSLLIDRGGENFSALSERIRVITIGSALTPEREKEWLRQKFPHTRLFVTYGCTEAAGFSHFEFSKYLPRPYCVGKAAKHSFFQIVDEDGNIVEADINNPGIIALGGDNVMKGYYGDKELTARTIRNGRVITADIGYKDADGFYYVLGRRDDVIISGGFKIAPSEVENALLQIDEVQDAACIGIEDKLLGHKPKVFVVLRQNSEVTVEDIHLQISKILDMYKVPDVKNIELIENIPRAGEVGKILYRELRKR